MGRYRRYRGYSGRTRNFGAERAREHINAAQQLTRELGGADEKVKLWLFSRSGSELERILQAYGLVYGASARSYAAKVIPSWQFGRVKMSGMVAERLFKLLPPFMPFNLKYEIVEGLWRYYGPSSKQTVWVSPDVPLATLMAYLQQRIDLMVSSYSIPAALEARFSWLAADDVGIKQQLLNHLRSTDKAMAVANAAAKIPVLIEHIKSEKGSMTKHLSQTLTVGKHLLEVTIDRHATGIQITKPSAPVTSGAVALRVIVVLAVLALFFVWATHR